MRPVCPAPLLDSPVPHRGVSLSPWPGQERKQRSELLEGLRSEAARLRQRHDAELKALQAELEGRLTALQQRHREKVSSRPCLWPLGLLRDSLGAPHLVPQAPCTAQGGTHKWQVTLPSLCVSGEDGACAILFNSATLCRKESSRIQRTSLKSA